MNSVKVNGVELEYEAIGSGEPVLLISPVLADGFLPLLSEPALADRYKLIRYHKRGWVGSTHTPVPVSVSDHAADAATLLDHLGIRRAHIAGHSSGAAVAAQLALDCPERVHTLLLLELSLLSVPSGEAFFEQAGPAFEAYASGDHSRALAVFMTAVSGLDWTECRALLEERVPGAVAQAVEDADTFFGVELPALTEWQFGPEQATAIDRPVLSVLGSETEPLWVEVAELLRSSLPQVEELRVDGVGHLLHIQRPEPVARGMAEFLRRNSMADGFASRPPADLSCYTEPDRSAPAPYRAPAGAARS
jgi:pimeloyl-ACP methyl ester carboxylesterase